jgi:hypothetical protein
MVDDLDDLDDHLNEGRSDMDEWLSVIPRSEKEGTKPPYVCPGCSNHTHDNN